MKKIGFYLIMLAFVLLSLELMAQLAYRIMYGDFYDQAQPPRHITGAEDAQRRPRKGRRAPGFVQVEPLHPYLGYVSPRGKLFPQAHGFFNNYSPQQPTAPNTLSILLTGGSVAAQAMEAGLQERFNAYLQQQGASLKVRIFSTAMGGYKQPQQLLATNYLLSIGAHFDMVINLDGFNEVVLPYVDNVRVGVYPFFPRAWAARLQTHGDSPEVALALGSVAYLRGQQQYWLRFGRERKISASAVVGLALALRLDSLDRAIQVRERRLSQRRDGLSFAEKGPTLASDDQAEIYRLSADLWQRTSIMMAQQLAAQGIEYYHFLQPSQYLKGSKPLSDMEREMFYLPKRGYGPSATLGYPLLVARGRKLVESGVNYFDVTQIFADQAVTIYKDSCCHINAQGNALLADFLIAKVVANSQLFPATKDDP